VARLFAALVGCLGAVIALMPSQGFACEKHLEGHHTGSDTGAEASGR
jgi:hypothetical protein